MIITKNIAAAPSGISTTPIGQVVGNVCRQAPRLLRNATFAVASRGTTFIPAVTGVPTEKEAKVLTGWKVRRNGSQVVNVDQYRAEVVASPKTASSRGMAVSWAGSTAATNEYVLLEQLRYDVETVAGQTAQLVICGLAGATRTMILEAVLNEGNGTISKSISNPFVFTPTESTSLVSIAIPPLSGIALGATKNLAIRIWLSAGAAFIAGISAISSGDGSVTITSITELGLQAQDYVDAVRDCEKYYINRTERWYLSSLGSTDTANSVCAVTIPLAMAKAPTAGQITTTYQFTTAAPTIGDSSANHLTLVATASSTTGTGAARINSYIIDIE